MNRIKINLLRCEYVLSHLSSKMGLLGFQKRYLRSQICMLLLIVTITTVGLSLLPLKLVDHDISWTSYEFFQGKYDNETTSCATVEQMGESFKNYSAGWKDSLRVRNLIQRHFHINGADRVRHLEPEQFCGHGFVVAKAEEKGFGNEMYKILTAAALSIMLNRSLIITQSSGKYPFGDYITYSNLTFTLKQVDHLWRKNGCLSKYGRELVVRVDDFRKPSRTSILCGNWREWEDPIIWLQNTTDTIAAQFFLKNVHPEMRSVAFELFGKRELESRPNVFGELMKVLISPSPAIEAAVNSVLAAGNDPDITLHMRMMKNRPVRAIQAALNCVTKAMQNLQQDQRPKVVLVSDNPFVISMLKPHIEEFAEVVHFDHELYQGNISTAASTAVPDSRLEDWGPAPRWVAIVDFFLAARAKHAVVSGAHRRVGTTYAQLIAALAAAYNLDDNLSTTPDMSFLSSFQRNLLKEGLRKQIGWGHAWNRFAGPLSCNGQATQCAYTPFLPPAWWDGIWQSPIPRDIHRLQAYGIQLSTFGNVDTQYLSYFCTSRKVKVIKLSVSSMLKDLD